MPQSPDYLVIVGHTSERVSVSFVIAPGTFSGTQTARSRLRDPDCEIQTARSRPAWTQPPLERMHTRRWRRRPREQTTTASCCGFLPMTFKVWRMTCCGSGVTSAQCQPKRNCRQDIHLLLQSFTTSLGSNGEPKSYVTTECFQYRTQHSEFDQPQPPPPVGRGDRIIVTSNSNAYHGPSSPAR
jgi:hypothetical protein